MAQRVKSIIQPGDVFGRLTVIKELEKNKHGKRNWLCKCECGAEKRIEQGPLKSGVVTSCGCFRLERLREVITKHGDTPRCHKARLYNTWSKMKSRCYSPKDKRYDNYGGRGIHVCEEWKEYQPFREWALSSGYSDDLTIERIDVNGNYEPSNCCWIPMKEQAQNKTNNIFFQGKSVSEWAKEVGISGDTIRARITAYGWDIQRAIFEPLHKSRFSNKKEA